MYENWRLRFYFAAIGCEWIIGAVICYDNVMITTSSNRINTN